MCSRRGSLIYICRKTVYVCPFWIQGGDFEILTIPLGKETYFEILTIPLGKETHWTGFELKSALLILRCCLKSHKTRYFSFLFIQLEILLVFSRK